MPTEVVAALLGAVVGGALGIGGAWSTTYMHDRRRRRAIATALYLETLTLEVALNTIHPPSIQKIAFFTAPMHDRFIEVIEYFPAHVAQPVLLSQWTLTQLRDSLAAVPGELARGPIPETVTATTAHMVQGFRGVLNTERVALVRLGISPEVATGGFGSAAFALNTGQRTAAETDRGA